MTETFAKIIGREGRLWIGLNDLAENGNFTWIDGEPFAFFRWYPGEPNNIGTEHYVYMSEGKFDNARDISIDHEGRPVCAVVKVQPSAFVPAMTAVEAVSEPASAVMAAWKSLLVAGILLFLSGLLLGGVGVFAFQKIR